jgi:hypothetical protein
MRVFLWGNHAEIHVDANLLERISYFENRITIYGIVVYTTLLLISFRTFSLIFPQ